MNETATQTSVDPADQLIDALNVFHNLITGYYFLARAELAAQTIWKTGMAKNIYLYGSIAQKATKPDDIDLVVEVDSDLARAFLTKVKTINGEYSYNKGSAKSLRYDLTIAFLHLDRDGDIRTAQFGLPKDILGYLSINYKVAKTATLLDIHLLPEDWQTDEALCARMDPEGKDFLPSIAAYAKLFDPSTGHFIF